MSAIWGLISNNTISSQTISNMQQSMQDFKIDHYDHIIQPNVYFACGHQYFTNESMNDKSPIYDEKSHVYFTGDCFLYNRAEVIQALSSHNVQQLLPNEDLSLLGDVHLSYLGFLLWGESFVTHLKGSFSFAIYDTTQKTLLLYTDHLACRYLAYYIDKQDVCFSTVYQPIHAFCGKSNLKLSKEWIATAYTDCTSDTLKIPGATVYDNIYHIEAGHYVKIDLNSKKVTNITYWNPLNSNIRLYKATDQEYKELFNSTFNSVIKGMLRARNNTGISLSGGLDSSAVAGFAAVNLKAQ